MTPSSARLLHHDVRGAPRRAVRRAARWVAVVVVALSAATTAVLALGGVSADVGPLTTRLHLALATGGGTQVDLEPFGRITLDTHAGPLRLRARVEEVRPSEVGALVRAGLSSRDVREGVTAQVRDGVVDLARRSAVVGLVGAALGCALVFHRWRAVLVGVVATATALGVSGVVAAATFRSEAVAEPAFDGLLSGAPALLGRVAGARVALDAQARRVSELTSNIAQLYTALDARAADPADDAVRVLWVSDLHNDTAAYGVMATLVERFDVAAVLDTGDSTDLGSPAENGLHAAKGTFGVPYVWVRGNHDSAGTQAYLAGLPGVTVLDGGAVAEVAGLRVAGTGDPRFTPVRRVLADEGAREELLAAGADLAAAVRASPQDVDVALVHEPGMAPPLHGEVPLVLDGHVHERRSQVVAGTLELTQGSSGGAGLRSFDGEGAQPLEMSVLHLDADTGDLLAVDDITIGGVGQRSISLERRSAESYALQDPPATAPQDPPATAPEAPTGTAPQAPGAEVAG